MDEPESVGSDVTLRPLKVCFIGNTNNYPFLIAAAMHRMGHSVTMLLDRHESLHRPDGRYAGVDLPNHGWIRDLSGCITPESWRLARCDELDPARLNEHDLIVVNGVGPALVGKSRVPVFAILTGSDLTHLADPSSVRALWLDLPKRIGWVRASLAALLHARLVARQRRTISRAVGVSYFVSGVVPKADQLLEGMGIGPSRRVSFMLSDVDHIAPAPWQAGRNRLRVFNVARLNWRLPKPAHMSELDMKGTDVLLEGFAMFVRRHGGGAELVLVRKGVDVQATELEVERLGIGQHVTWLDEMSQSEVFDQYALADVVIEQLSTSYVGMGGLDAMASGRPVIANTRPDAPARDLLDDSPVLHATTPDDVCGHLEVLAGSVALRRDLGERSRRYVERRHSPSAAAHRILALLTAANIAPGGHAA